MNKVLNGLSFTLAYLDDVIIFSETAEQHLKHIQIVLTRLNKPILSLRKASVPFKGRNSLPWPSSYNRFAYNPKQKRSEQSLK